MFLSKYGVARHVYIPIVKRAVVDHAVGADWTPAAGDVKISKDGGAAANVTNLPTAIAMGNSALWDFSLTATEMQAAQIVVTVADSATKAVEDTAFIIETYGNASGQHEIDLDQPQLDANVTKVAGTAQTAGDIIGDTNDIQSRLPAALTADGNIKADTLRVGGTLQTAGDLAAMITAVDDYVDTEVADILVDTSTTLDDLVDDLESRLTAALATALQAHALGIGRGVVDAGSTTTAIVFKSVNGAAASGTDDFYNGRHIVFTSGALTLQATSISDYTGASKTATVPAVTGAPAEDVTFILV